MQDSPLIRLDFKIGENLLENAFARDWAESAVER